MSTFKLFEPEHLQQLCKENDGDYDDYDVITSEVDKNKVDTTTANQHQRPRGSILSRSAIEFINRSHPVRVLSKVLTHPGAIFQLAWSSDGSMLVTASTIGSLRIWDTSDWKMLTELRDKSETAIEEFYIAQFIPHGNNAKIVATGKRKDRDRWNHEEQDNQVLPGKIKVTTVLLTAGDTTQCLCPGYTWSLFITHYHSCHVVSCIAC
jgi:WD40 repeat protein